MRASKADKFYMGMLLAIICFCFGLLRICLLYTSDAADEL